jgi:hypothetical protein
MFEIDPVIDREGGQRGSRRRSTSRAWPADDTGISYYLKAMSR